MHRISFAAVALTLALAACSDGEDEADTGEALNAGEIAEQVREAPEVRPGQYESTGELLEFELAGIPAGQVDSIRSMMAGELERPTTYCLTPEQAQRGPEEMLQKLAESDCDVNRLDVSPSGMSGEMQCAGEGGMNGTVKVDGTMRGDSSTVTFETIQSVPGMPGEGAHLKMRLTSRRIGECAA